MKTLLLAAAALFAAHSSSLAQSMPQQTDADRESGEVFAGMDE